MYIHFYVTHQHQNEYIYNFKKKNILKKISHVMFYSKLYRFVFEINWKKYFELILEFKYQNDKVTSHRM